MKTPDLSPSPLFTGQIVNKISSILRYIFVAGSIIFFGIKLINRSIDSKFYLNYISQWEITCKKSISVGIRWPAYRPEDKNSYMESLTEKCKNSGIGLPKSNTNFSYIYEINKIGDHKSTVFILCLPAKIIMFGLSNPTMKRIDNYVDNKVDLSSGKFTAFPTKQNTYTGILKL